MSKIDLKGATPESWACVDCGINTAPGFPSRIEMERRYNTAAAMTRTTVAQKQEQHNHASRKA